MNSTQIHKEPREVSGAEHAQHRALGKSVCAPVSSDTWMGSGVPRRPPHGAVGLWPP